MYGWRRGKSGYAVATRLLWWGTKIMHHLHDAKLLSDDETIGTRYVKDLFRLSVFYQIFTPGIGGVNEVILVRQNSQIAPR